MTLYPRRDKPLERTIRHREWGKRPWNEVLVRHCSKCKLRAAHWIESSGNRQRYYCDECIKVTKAWNELEAAKKKGAKQ